jgi:chemotaxis protein methyltransferase CheR
LPEILMNEYGQAVIQPITDMEFSLLQALIYREAGIFLSPVKKALLVGRLSKRLRELGLRTFKEYYGLVKEGNEEERVYLFNAISTNETHFFREAKHFEFLDRQVFPEWSAQAEAGLRARKIRVWSAACSTGEEPYSLAMMLLDRFPPGSGWEIEILASDLSTKALDAARQGVWSMDRAQEIPDQYRKTFMLKGMRSQEGKMKAGPGVSSLIRFVRINLNSPPYPVAGYFDMIFCRNVLIYFDNESKSRVIHALLDHLTPQGYFFLGHAESLHGFPERVRNVIPAVYVHAGAVKTVFPAGPTCGSLDRKGKLQT